MIELRYSEKATKNGAIFRKIWKLRQIFVAFSENLNFTIWKLWLFCSGNVTCQEYCFLLRFVITNCNIVYFIFTGKNNVQDLYAKTFVWKCKSFLNMYLPTYYVTKLHLIWPIPFRFMKVQNHILKLFSNWYTAWIGINFSHVFCQVGAD